MASVASQLIEEVTAHVQSESLEDAREICADVTYFPNSLRILLSTLKKYYDTSLPWKLVIRWKCKLLLPKKDKDPYIP